VHENQEPSISAKVIITRKNMGNFGNRFKPISFQKKKKKATFFEQVWANRQAKDGASLLPADDKSRW